MHPSERIARPRGFRVTVLALILVAGAFSPLLLAPGASAAEPSNDARAMIENALKFVRSRTMKDGATNSPDTTPWAILALASVDQDPWKWQGPYGPTPPCAYLRDHPAAYANRNAATWSLIVMAVIACGEDPATFGNYDWLAKLLSFHTAGPPLTDYKQMGDPNTWNDDMFAVMALKAARASDNPAYRDALDEVLRKQRADGGWACCAASSTSDPEMTSAAIMAIRAAGTPPGDVTLARATLYLDGQQNADGSFPAPDSPLRATAWAVAAIHALGEDPETGRWRTATGATPISYFRIAQLSNGAFPTRAGSLDSHLLATIETVLALSANPHPVHTRLLAQIAWTPTLPRTLDPVEFRDTVNAPDSVTYAWTFPTGPGSADATPTHQFTQQGMQNVSLTVTDAARGLGRASARVDVLNRAPTASLEIFPNVTSRGREVEVRASGVDIDGVVRRVKVDYGDGAGEDWSTVFNTRHAYTELGSFIVAVTVEDNAGARATANAEVRVVNLPPLVDIGGNRVANRTAPVSLTAFTFDDPEGLPLTARWDFGDGNSSTSRTVAHTYAELGSHHVVFTAKDPEGGVTRAHLNVTVVNLPPVVDRFENDRDNGFVSDTFTFKATAHDPDGPGIATILWNWGDSAAWSTLPYHAYARNGTFVVTVEVKDKEGARTELRRTVQVGSAPTNPPPVIADLRHAPDSPRAGENVTLSARVTDDANVTRTVIHWRTTSSLRERVILEGGNISVDIGAFTRGDVVDWWVVALDDRGARTESTTRTFVVAARPRPELSATLAPVEPASGESVTINMTALRVAQLPAEYRVDWGDGSPAAWRPERIESHAYARPGLYEVVVGLRDAEGFASDPWTTQVLVQNRPPIVVIRSPPAGHVALGSFKATGGATDVDGSIVRLVATLNGHPVKLQGGATWVVDIDTSILAPGNHELVIIATDDASTESPRTVLAFVVPSIQESVTMPTRSSARNGTQNAPGTDGVGNKTVPAFDALVVVVGVGVAALLVGSRRVNKVRALQRREGGPSRDDEQHRVRDR